MTIAHDMDNSAICKAISAESYAAGNVVLFFPLETVYFISSLLLASCLHF